MPEPVFSVVIPAYNSGGFVIKTLECLSAQDFKDFEAVIINDGSSDNTQEVIKGFISAHPDLNLRLINQENRGIAGARNRGIKEAKADYIAFLDHDDLWHPQKLSRCHEVLSRFPEVDLICHDEVLRDAGGNLLRRLHYGPLADDMFRRLLFRGNSLSTSATVVRRSALLRVGSFKEGREFSTVEDYDLWLRLSKECRFYFIPEVLGEYVINNKNASLEFERHYLNQIRVLNENFNGYDKKKPEDELRIKFRIAKLYAVIAKNFLQRKTNLKYAFGYLLKALTQIFSYGS